MRRTTKRTSAPSLVIVVGAVAVGMGMMAAVIRRLRRPRVEVVPRLDLGRYMGTWHEIAHMPNWFERGCQDTTATYSRFGNGKIQVVNRCWRRGREVTTEATAWVPDAAVPGRLTVQFQWPFRADYEIMYVDGDYHVAVVGTRNRRNAWILCREPHLDEETYQLCCDFLADQGFDPGRLMRTSHTRGLHAPRRIRPIATALPA